MCDYYNKHFEDAWNWHLFKNYNNLKHLDICGAKWGGEKSVAQAAIWKIKIYKPDIKILHDDATHFLDDENYPYLQRRLDLAWNRYDR